MRHHHHYDCRGHVIHNVVQHHDHPGVIHHQLDPARKRYVDDAPCVLDDCPHRIHDDNRQLINNVNAEHVNFDDGPGRDDHLDHS